VCDLETSWMRRPWPTGGCRAKRKKIITYWFIMGQSDWTLISLSWVSRELFSFWFRQCRHSFCSVNTSHSSLPLKRILVAVHLHISGVNCFFTRPRKIVLISLPTGQQPSGRDILTWLAVSCPYL